MGIFKDISDTIRDLKTDYDKSEIKDYAKRIKGSSLARTGAEGTLQFPVIISNSLNIDTALMITKSLERQFASFTQITLSLHPYLDLSKDKDISSYLKNFHQNSGGRFNTLGSLLLEGSYNILSNESDEICGLFITTEGCNGKVLKDNRIQLFSVMDYINENSLNDLYKPRNPRVNFKNKNLNNFYNNEIITEADYNDNFGTTNPSGPDAAYELRGEMRHAKIGLTDNDCKKANELVPTTLALSLNVKDKGTFRGTVNFVIGVKAIMHPVDSSEVVKNMVYACKNSNKFFNFVRWTTGEISFLKDFILHLDQIKSDAISRSSTNNSWWGALKRRKAVARTKRLLPTGKQLMPNATVVMTIEEVNKLKVEHGFDIMNSSMMRKIMDEYFLLAFVIVDVSQELAYFMFDGQNEPQTMSFSGLERENNSKNDFKEIYKLINSGRL